MPFQYNDNKFVKNSASSNLFGNRIYYARNSECNGNEFAYNTAGNYVYYGWLHLYSNDSKILNNIYHNNYGGYGELYGLYVGYSNNQITAHNTIAVGDVTGGYYNYMWYVFYNQSYTGSKFMNNILTCTTTPGFGYGYPIYSTTTGVDWGGNVVDLKGTYTKYFRVANTNYATFALWAAAMEDETSIEADPQYTNLAQGDLTPRNPKIANIGIAGLSSDDYLGKSRTACGPDPGAKEFYVDHSVTNSSSLPANECGGFTMDFSVTLSNGTNVAMAGVPVF